MFSSTSQYAIRTVLYLAKNQAENKKFRVQDISLELEIPESYLRKILQQLSKHRIVSSTKGPNGGIYLTDENMEHSILDVLTCIEGHDVFESCVLGLPKCSSKNPCYLHTYYLNFKEDLQEMIKDASLNDLNNSGSLDKISI